jgi:DNA repair exonuclease SbcCD ATPase subunit
MLRFNKIILHNFGSYGHTEVDLNNKGFCLVSGKNNYKKDNALSNGAGKSFLWSAICFALTGETIGGLSKNLKNINIEDDKTCYVTLEFKINKDVFVITRHIEPRSDLKIIKNDVDVSGKGIRESEKKLGEFVPDLTKDLIASILILGQGMPNKFSSFSPAGRKEVLEKLTKSDYMIEDIKNRVATRLAAISARQRELEDALLVNRTQLSAIDPELTTKSRELAMEEAVNYETEITLLENQATKISEDLKTAQANATQIDEKIEQINAELLEKTNKKSEMSNEEFASYNVKFTELNTQKVQIQGQINALVREVTRIKNIKDICPTCGQKLQGVTKPSTENEEAEITRLNNELATINSNIIECNNLHATYQAQINETFKADLDTLNTALINLKKDSSLQKNNISDFTHYLNRTNEDLAKLKLNKDIHIKKIQDLTNRINELNIQKEALSTTQLNLIEAKTEESKHLAVVKKIETLIKRDFRGYLLSNIIKYLDKKAKDLSEIVFGTRELNIYIDGNALDISYCGKMIEALSGGERTRVDLIIQFAIRDMLSVYLNINSNILVLDEVTDFLDKQSCGAVMQLIEKELNTVESVFIISHHAETLDLPIDSEICVIKNEYGISEVH